MNWGLLDFFFFVSLFIVFLFPIFAVSVLPVYPIVTEIQTTLCALPWYLLLYLSLPNSPPTADFSALTQ